MNTHHDLAHFLLASTMLVTASIQLHDQALAHAVCTGCEALIYAGMVSQPPVPLKSAWAAVKATIKRWLQR